MRTMNQNQNRRLRLRHLNSKRAATSSNRTTREARIQKERKHKTARKRTTLWMWMRVVKRKTETPFKRAHLRPDREFPGSSTHAEPGGSATGWRWESTATAHATGDITSPRVASHSHPRFPSPLISPCPSSATKRSDSQNNVAPTLGEG